MMCGYVVRTKRNLNTGFCRNVLHSSSIVFEISLQFNIQNIDVFLCTITLTSSLSTKETGTNLLYIQVILIWIKESLE